MRSFILYGLGGADVQYKAIGYYIVSSEDFAVRGIKDCAGFMRMHNPSIQSVYLVDNRPGLKREYNYSIKDRHNSIEARYTFKDTLEREGIRIF